MLRINHPRALDYTIQDSYNLDITVDGRKSLCQVIDTSGQEGYEILQDAIEDADGVIVVFSLDTIQSFHRAKSLLNIVRAAKGSPRAVGAASASSDDTTALPVALVGTKLDLSLKRQVSRYDAACAAKGAGCALFECSALVGKGVWDPFCEVIRVVGRGRTSGRKGVGWI
jgi:GTPase SAR1 family protein